jgi:hypothetical protein
MLLGMRITKFLEGQLFLRALKAFFDLGSAFEAVRHDFGSHSQLLTLTSLDHLYEIKNPIFSYMGIQKGLWRRISQHCSCYFQYSGFRSQTSTIRLMQK